MRKALFPFRLLYFFYRKVLKVFCRDRKEYLRILVNTSLRVEHSNLFRRYASLRGGTTKSERNYFAPLRFTRNDVLRTLPRIKTKNLATFVQAFVLFVVYY